MTAEPTPTVVRSERSLARPVPRDVPITDFVAMVEASGADAAFLDSIRSAW